ncbi:MAG TPA: alpha/beta family hydrolase [Kofleriaceae bacterium]|nr:alpha/beta family hydrolase [Kofleriaceae bacterium]
MTAEAATEVAIPTPRGPIAGLLVRPPAATWLYVFGHGAGAGMRHPFMTAIAGALAARSIATLRWEQPAMTAGRRRPDPPPVVEELARAACVHARATFPELRLCAGGKSMGGRMTSQAMAKESMAGIEALAFLGFPLHPAGAPATERARHLAAVTVPMLFVQGSRDALAEPSLLRPVLAALPTAQLIELEGADHGLAVAKRAGIDPIAVAADAIARFLAALPAGSAPAAPPAPRDS